MTSSCSSRMLVQGSTSSQQRKSLISCRTYTLYDWVLIAWLPSSPCATQKQLPQQQEAREQQQQQQRQLVIQEPQCW